MENSIKLQSAISDLIEQRKCGKERLQKCQHVQEDIVISTESTIDELNKICDKMNMSITEYEKKCKERIDEL